MWEHTEANGAKLLIGRVDGVVRDEDGKVGRIKVSIHKGLDTDSCGNAGEGKRKGVNTEKKRKNNDNEDSRNREQPTQVKLKADAFVFAMGPWTVMCERRFPDIDIPMVGIKNSSVILRSCSSPSP
mmetsp:Transcript_20457/g.28733  ORF Transcript_20457/g.28733 Transcript_20457/m.28733 type:complete len:126 (-) Transcript_20457:114-491(-)|eukprot:CAMPEP_0185266336 /NCGR_PEP_ID=MMETSP1359-20130426/30758_1 /TAXON_ID=552665 /ORGANISM="Bigelowiella longifila, Strain CCMP242" /LENGTH=125 /DNA_ID=CAMNT_0027856107 /DNA_START=110 /DNA_END=487 /DNA_ORIENTATION=+